MFSLKLFKRNQPSVRRHVSPPAAPVAPQWTAPSRAAGPPPPPPPPEAFLSSQAPVIPFAAISEPTALSGPAAEPWVVDAQVDIPHVPASQVDAAPAPARVRFFYSDGTVSEPDAEETERLGYLATNLLEASRDDIG